MRDRFLGRLTIRWALLLFFTIGVIIPVVIFSYLFTGNLNRILRGIESESAELAITSNVHQLETVVESISYTAAYISSSSDVLSYLNTMADAPESADAIFARERLMAYIRNLTNATMYSLNPEVSVITRTGRVVGFEKVEQLSSIPDVFTNKLLDENRAVWYNVLKPETTGNLEATWPIRGLDQQIIALLHIKVPQKWFWEKMTNHPFLQYKQEIYNRDTLICVNNSYVITNPNKATVFEEQIKTWGMKLVVTVPTNVLNARVNNQQTMFLGYFVMLILILFLIINAISNYMGVPINILLGQMHKLQKADFSLTPAPNSFKEINLLSENLNEVSECIYVLMDTASKQAAMKENMRFEALMAQINPHFLNNTLNSIKWISSINGNNLAADMLSRLGNILHYSFSKSGDFIALKEELHILDDYVALMQVRYGNTITYITDVPEELLSCQIPRFCLQPILENAIMHGNFAFSKGLITVSAVRQNDRLIVSVKDNGAGMNQQDADQLTVTKTESVHSTGIGIWNIQERIKLLFGNNYGLKITSSPDQGCLVDMTLPYKTS